MTFAKGFALSLGFIGAMALGVWVGPHITHRDASFYGQPTGTVATDVAGAQTPATSLDEPLSAREARRVAASSHAASKPAIKRVKVAPGTTPRIVPTAAPALHDRLKPLLNKGADMAVAAQNFVDAEQFAAVAHAARNTEVPFMVLKHRVVEEGKSLEAAIRELKPSLNASAEAKRAREEAKSDISALNG